MFQILALFPGISRSGITISVGLLFGIQYDKAARFSFLLAVPVLLGAGILQIITIDGNTNIPLISLFVGFLTSAIVGYLVIDWLLKIITNGKFYLFSIYCCCVSVLLFIIVN